MTAKKDLDTAAAAATKRIKQLTDAIAVGGVDSATLGFYAAELRDEANRMLEVLQQPILPPSMVQVTVTAFGAIEATWFYSVQVDASLKPAERRDTAVALVKAGGQEVHGRRTGLETSTPRTYGTDIDGLVQP